MKREIPLIAVAVFLLVMGFYFQTMQYADAITFTDIELTQAPALGDTFSDGTRREIWLASDTHVKVISQVSNSIVANIAISGGGVTDVKCGSTHCFAFQSTTTPFRLWKISATTVGGLYSIVGSVNGTSGAEGGRVLEVIDVVVSGIGSTTVLLPIATTDCDGLGGGDEVLALIDGILVNTTNSFSTVCAGIITLGDFISGIAHSGKFQQTIGDQRNSVMVKFLNAVTNNVKIFDLATQAQVCQVTFGSGGLENHVYTRNDYWFVGNVATDSLGLFLTPQSSGANCVQDDSVIAPTNYELRAGVDIDTSHGYLFLPTMATAGTDSYISVRNLTVSQNEVELFRLVMEDGTVRHNFYFAPDDELFATNLEDTSVRVFSLGDPIPPDTETTTICYIVQGSSQQFCQTYDVDEDGNIILPSVIGGVNPRNITTTSNELFCSLGISDCNNPDIQTNGTGMFMLLILIIISYAFVVAIHHFAHSPLSNINPMLVLLIGIVDITIAFFLGWIPDLVFYSVIVLLVGLGGFGLYRIIRGV